MPSLDRGGLDQCLRLVSFGPAVGKVEFIVEDAGLVDGDLRPLPHAVQVVRLVVENAADLVTLPADYLEPHPFGLLALDKGRLDREVLVERKALQEERLHLCEEALLGARSRSSDLHIPALNAADFVLDAEQRSDECRLADLPLGALTEIELAQLVVRISLLVVSLD